MKFGGEVPDIVQQWTGKNEVEIRSLHVLFYFPQFYTYPLSKKYKQNSSPSRKIMKFGEQGDTIFLRITAKNGIKLRTVARDMDLCLLKKSVSTCTNLPFAY